MLTLATSLSGPFQLLYVLHTTRTGAELGRYESPELSADAMEEFLRQFGRFLGEDSRHDLWVRSHDDDATIVLDRHNVIYAYGPLDAFEAALQSLGARRGEPAVLGAHVHHQVVASLFLEDVTAWLELHDIRFTPNVKFTGRSGYDHTFDFVVPASRRAPERLIRAVNRPSRDLAEAMAFSWVDTKEVRPVASKFYAFLNDENRPPATSIVDALRNYDIVPVLWSRRDEVRQELAA